MAARAKCMLSYARLRRSEWPDDHIFDQVPLNPEIFTRKNWLLS